MRWAILVVIICALGILSASTRLTQRIQSPYEILPTKELPPNHIVVACEDIYTMLYEDTGGHTNMCSDFDYIVPTGKWIRHNMVRYDPKLAVFDTFDCEDYVLYTRAHMHKYYGINSIGYVENNFRKGEADGHAWTVVPYHVNGDLRWMFWDPTVQLWYHPETGIIFDAATNTYAEKKLDDFYRAVYTDVHFYLF